MDQTAQNGVRTRMIKSGSGTDVPIKYSCTDIIKLFEFTKNPTMQALAVTYARMGWPVFPCKIDKTPIVDPLFGFTRGSKDATTDLKRIAKAWHKYPNAAIGFAILPRIVVIDLDVLKDRDKVPIKKEDGTTIFPGLKSFQDLIEQLYLPGCLDTLTVDTQSGGRQLYYMLPEGYQSFNHTAALPGLDIKGYGGYVILPNSQGKFGNYSFRHLSAIMSIPEGLLNWIEKFRNPEPHASKVPIIRPGTATIDLEEVVKILLPYWQKADGRRNDFTLAIAGFIARSGGNEGDAKYVVSELCERTGKGRDHINGTKYAFRRNGPIKGLNSIEKIMGEIENDKE